VLILNVVRESRILKNAENFLTSRQHFSFSRRNQLQVHSYVEERNVSSDTPVNESRTLCVVRVDKLCFKKTGLENRLHIAGYTCDGHPYINRPK
jgi:hypothetical protein